MGIKNNKRGRGKTVLVVDDHAAIRKMIVSAFVSDGFKECGEAEDGKEAIEVAKRIKPDVVTMDLAMPVMNGLAASAALRKIFPKLPIILFTLYADANLKTEAAHAGINLVLLKTVPVLTLLDSAHELMADAATR